MKIVLQTWHNVTVCGMKGTGKTTLERSLLPKYPHVLVFDPDNEYENFEQYIPSTDSPEELDQKCAEVYENGNCLLLVSEAEIYLPVNAGLGPNIFKLITRGRRRNIGLMADTRRIANLNKTVFGLSEHCFVFRHFSPTDLRYLSEFLPSVEQVAKLPDFWFVHYSKGLMQVCSPVKAERGTHAKRRGSPKLVEERPKTDSQDEGKNELRRHSFALPLIR